MKTDYSEYLQGILQGTRGGAYIAGTLWFGNAHASPDGEIHVVNHNDSDETAKRELTKRERYLLCKIYIENKTTGCSFYKYAKEYAEKYERIADEILLIYPSN